MSGGHQRTTYMPFHTPNWPYKGAPPVHPRGRIDNLVTQLDRSTLQTPHRRRPHNPWTPPPRASPGPVAQLNRPLNEINPNDDVFPVSRARFGQWRAKLDQMENMCRAMRRLDLGWKDKNKLREYIEGVKSASESLKGEMEERTKGPRLEGLNMVRR